MGLGNIFSQGSIGLQCTKFKKGQNSLKIIDIFKS